MERQTQWRWGCGGRWDAKAATLENCCQLFKYLNKHLPYHPAFPFLGIYPRKKEKQVHAKNWAQMYLSSLRTGQDPDAHQGTDIRTVRGTTAQPCSWIDSGQHPPHHLGEPRNDEAEWRSQRKFQKMHADVHWQTRISGCLLSGEVGRGVPRALLGLMDVFATLMVVMVLWRLHMSRCQTVL